MPVGFLLVLYLQGGTAEQSKQKVNSIVKIFYGNQVENFSLCFSGIHQPMLPLKINKRNNACHL